MITKYDYNLENNDPYILSQNVKPLHILFDQKVDANPEGIAFEDLGKSYKFRQIQNYSKALASWMLDHEIRKGDVVSLFMPSSTEFAIAHIATSRVGAVISPLHIEYGKKELTELISFSDSKLLIADLSYRNKDLSKEIMEVVEKAHLSNVLTNGDSKLAEQGWENFWDICRNYNYGQDYPAVMSSDPIGLFFTSGTESGEPKGCIHTHSSLMGNAISVSRDAGIGKKSVIMSGSGFSHLFGLLALHLSLLSGSTNVIIRKFVGEEFYSMAEKYKPTHVFLVPTELRDLVNLMGNSEKPFESVKELRIAGAALPQDLAKEIMNKTNINLVNHWGMTELGAGSYTKNGNRSEIISGSIGKPVQGAHIAILSEEGKLVVNAVGEILFRGTSLFKGYYKLPMDDFIFEDHGEKWFRTGDLGIIDENGTVRYMGRKKDIINRGGIKINCREVEIILEEMKGIDAASIVPVPDSRLGERSCLFYSTLDKIGKKEIIEYLESRGISKYQWPEYFVLENNMPRTPTGKITKGKLAERAKNMFAH